MQGVAVAGRGIARRLSLPMENALNGVAGQGWQVATVVGRSRIPGAGNGRFAAEVVPQKSKVVAKILTPMSQIDSLTNLPKDRTITFENIDDLEKYLKLGMSEGGFSREDVHETFAHFIYGFDGRRACLNASTWTINHADTVSDGLNVNFFEGKNNDGTTALIGESIVDIQVQDELRNNYRDFVMPEFYKAYCLDHNFKDVRTATLEAVDGRA